MKGLLRRHGIGSTVVEFPLPQIIDEPLEAKKAQKEDAVMLPFSMGSNKFKSRRTKRNVERLKLFSESVLPSRAINLIRNGISSLKWAIQPKGNLKQEERDVFRDSIKTVENVLNFPNTEDGDFGTFIGQIVEDMLVFDAGCWEYSEEPEFMEKNKILELSAVAGHTIAQNIHWNGNPDSVRWKQIIGRKPTFKDSELEYIMQRKRSHSAFGYSQLETSVEVMEAWLGLSSYQRNVASNAYPAIMLYLGSEVKQDQADAMRSYWNVELAGRGTPGIWGNTGDPKVLQLKPAADEGLYLRYQEMLVRILAFSFGLKPQDFGLERDVNRSTAVVAQFASVEEARKPLAELLAKRINCKILPRISTLTGDKRIPELEFFWIGIDPRNRKVDAEIHDVYLKHDVLTIDDVRKDLNLAPLNNGLGKLTPSALKALFKDNPQALSQDLDIETVDKLAAEIKQIKGFLKASFNK